MDGSVEGQQSERINASYVSNIGYNTSSILQIRLDTQQLIQQTEYFLRGKMTRIVFDANGQPSEQIVDSGKPLANDEGVHSILAFLSSTVNSQVVQGNYEWDTWREEIAWCRKQLAKDLFINHDMWEVNPQNICLICNAVMNQIKPFLTRLVNNKERESYANYEHREINNQERSKGFIGGLFGGK